ncbi:HIT domain containing protein [Aureococcus anophagefferens]|nr:HIT domain containing protein [Aureococcus anophagefferens]
MSAAPYTLYDMPVSNNGARVRMILYYKDVPASDVAIVSPMELGGLRSDEFLAVNPQGKMPALVCRDEGLCVPRLPLQGDAGQPYGAFPSPAAAQDEFCRQLLLVEDYVGEAGPYLLGGEPSHGDCALYPTLLFAEKMLPLFAAPSPPENPKWFDFMSTEDAVGARVRGEVRGALDGWDAKGRWASIFGAGVRDDADATIFDKILAGDIPSDKVYEDDLCYAFRDINPVAPTHVLLIPKVRSGLTQLRHAAPDQAALLGHLMSKVGAVAEAAGLGDAGYRLVVNDGADACQTVFHLHLHIIGGRELAWPPG